MKKLRNKIRTYKIRKNKIRNNSIRNNKIKKKIFLSFAALTVFSLTGCVKTEIEKKPVTIADEAVASTPLMENDDPITEDASKDSSGEASEGSSDDSTKGLTEDKNENGSKNSNTPLQENDNSETEATTTDHEDGSEDVVKLTIELEGMEEEINGKRFTSSLNYQIIYDVDRFQVDETEDGFDSFMADNPNPEIYPYVYLNIYRKDKTTWDKSITSDSDSSEGSLWSSLMIGNAYYLDEVSIGSHQAKHYHTSPGNQWNSIVKDYYIIEQGEYYYVLETQYFLEAAEGYGARMRAMMDTIEFK